MHAEPVVQVLEQPLDVDACGAHTASHNLGEQAADALSQAAAVLPVGQSISDRWAPRLADIDDTDRSKSTI
eukprot:SAG31_NODE_1142_length_9696_cov_3.874232_11_plen_71_part_00